MFSSVRFLAAPQRVQAGTSSQLSLVVGTTLLALQVFRLSSLYDCLQKSF